MPMRLAMLGMQHSHAEGLVRQIAAHPEEFQLIGGFDPVDDIAVDRTKRWGKQLDGFQRFVSPQAALAQQLDGVIVEGLVEENLHWARLALEAGFPVMLEKPAGTELAEFQGLIELARREHLHVQMIYLFRYLTAVLEVLRLVSTGQLGQVYEFRARMPKEFRLYEDHREKYAKYQGGIFFEMAGHMIDMMVAMLGKPNRVVPFLAHHHASDDAFIDNGLAVFEFPRAWGIVEVSTLESVEASRRFEVFGTKGACAIPHLGSGHLANTQTQALDVQLEGDDNWRRIELPAATLQLPDLREFAACVFAKKQPDYAGDHDLIVQEALLRSSGAL